MSGTEGAAPRVTADRTVCVGAGVCALTAPGTFDQDEDGIVTVLEPRPGAGARSAAREAAALCPSRALRIAEVFNSA
ncbi:ferredoxin [Streptomyces sp. GS7]|uniref:ferredoxin n=1 Tax=Streptomyces sp. GS7 TaxID=2692234 RepID=UPI00131616C8|nr:ferredoxin [Streptomyces sp. GS7]QHC22932.1 ferredoxin [Streptomyces sp. GS7]